MDSTYSITPWLGRFSQYGISRGSSILHKVKIKFVKTSRLNVNYSFKNKLLVSIYLRKNTDIRAKASEPFQEL